jgi:chromosome segregation ATPase
MDFRQRKIAYEELKGTSHLDADKALLEKVDPKNLLLQKKVYKPETMALEILWELLGRADITREALVSNRRALANNSKPDLGDPNNDAELKAKHKADATIALLAAELVNMTQKELKALALVLEIESPDMKAATLRPLLEAYRNSLSPTCTQASEVETVPDEKSTESHSDQVIDQMNADIEDIKTQLLDEELTEEQKKELEKRLNDLEGTIDDLQDQHNDLQDQVNTLADDLEAEKKNQND